MSSTDPMSKTQLEALARRSVSGSHLSKNEQFELKQAVKYGVGDVEKILKGER